MKNKKKILGIILSLTILLIISVSIYNIKENKKIELIQLSNHTTTQMMGYIIKTKNDKMIIIDGGILGDTQNLMNYIEKHNNKVDYWFLTHNHNDHVTAFTEIAKNSNVMIDNIYVSLNEKEWYEEHERGRAEFSNYLIDLLNEEKIKPKVKTPALNEKIQIDGMEVEILGIRNPEITQNPGNEQSMVIKFNTGKTSILILGDTGEKSSEKLLKNQKEKLKSDIVQMSHHGQSGATKELYKEISPKICLWPSPDWLWNNDSGAGENSGPWKTLETRKWMEELGVTKNYIEKDGDITIKIK